MVARSAVGSESQLCSVPAPLFKNANLDLIKNLTHPAGVARWARVLSLFLLLILLLLLLLLLRCVT